MIRFWIAICFFAAGISVATAAEELPSPTGRAADVPPPPVPQLPALDLPLPDIGAPAKPMEQKPTEQKPIEQKPAEQKPADSALPVPPKPDPLLPTETPQAVAPSKASTVPPLPTPVLPKSAFPPPVPSGVVPANPPSSGPVLNGPTPGLPSEATRTPSAVLNDSLPNNNVPNDLKWRYKWHQGQWWYWSPEERWMIWDKNAWTPYDPATYQAPAGFAKPGPRVVTQQALSVPLPESYSGAEVSIPESYYLTPGSTYIAPTPYAFGADSYYGPNGPAASYYNRRRGVSLSIASPTYVPVYPSYVTPQYISPRYTAPVGGYPGYGVPGYYGGRGVTMGFGF